MKISIFFAYKTLFANKKLFFLVVGILILSFINLSFFNSLNNGIRDMTNEKLIIFTYADLQILPDDENEFIFNTNEVIEKLSNINGVYLASPRIEVPGILEDSKGFSFPPVIKGIDIQRELYITKFQDYIEIGNYLGVNDFNRIILGDEIIGNLDGSKGTTGMKTLDVTAGDELTLTYGNAQSRKYIVEGILDTLFWIPDFYMLINIEELRSAYNFSSDVSSEIIIKLDENTDKKEMITKIINTGIEHRVVDSMEEFNLAESILESNNITVALANVIGIFSTFIIVFIVTYININNKRKELGILKAIGIKEKDIILSYIYLSLIYSILGIVIGFFGLIIIIEYIKLNPIKLPMGFFYPKLDFFQISMSALIIMISSVFAGFFASISIVKSKIVNVLRGD